MPDKGAQVATRPLSKQDARDLIKVVEGRFTQLHKRVAQRELELAGSIRKDVYDDHASSMDDARKAFIEIGMRAHQLERDYTDAVNAAQEAGLSVRGNFHINWHAPDVQVTGIESIVRQRIAEMRTAGGQHKLSLHEMEQELRERILIASLTGEKALDFLGQIPSIDEILPLPNGHHQAIEAETTNEEE
jgi:hypothetical protein